MNGMTTPTLRVRPEAKLDALADTTYPSSRAAASTRARVAGDTEGLPDRARETVAVDTPARSATCWIRVMNPPGFSRYCLSAVVPPRAIHTVVSAGTLA